MFVLSCSATVLNIKQKIVHGRGAFNVNCRAIVMVFES